MKRSRTMFPALLLISLLGSCGTMPASPTHPLTDVGRLQREYEELLAQIQSDRVAVQPKMAVLATKAQTTARAASDPQNKVALYKIAALAAWQGGPAAGSSLEDIATEGSAACGQLPPAQQRPTDCAMIRLARPFAVADSFQLQLLALRDKLDRMDRAHTQRCDALTGATKQNCLAEVVKLPASDRPEVLQVFSGFEAAFTDAREVSHAMTDVGPGLQEAARNGQTIIYCDAEKTWLLSKRVDGFQPQDREALTCRRKRLDCLLTRSDADCADRCPNDSTLPVVPCEQFAGKPFTLPEQTAATSPDTPH